MAEKPEKVTKVEEAVNTPVATSRPWIIWVVVAAVGFVLLLTALGLFIVRAVHDRIDQANDMPVTQTVTYGGFRGGYQRGTFYTQSSTTSGPTTTTTTQKYTVTVGVVTKVNGDSVVVAGNGESQTIMTNGDTEYANDAKPEVNDTVRIIGTSADDKITATQVYVLNN